MSRDSTPVFRGLGATTPRRQGCFLMLLAGIGPFRVGCRFLAGIARPACPPGASTGPGRTGSDDRGSVLVAGGGVVPVGADSVLLGSATALDGAGGKSYCRV